MQTVEEILARANFYTDGDSYRFVQLPGNGLIAAAGVIAEVREAFIGLIVDKDEVTVMLEAEAYEEYQERLIGHVVSDIVYRLITIDIRLEPTMVGFIACVSAALAQAGVPVLTFAAYSRDHIFVPAHQFDVALQALKQLQEKARLSQEQ